VSAYTATDLAAYLQHDVDTATAMLVLKVATDAARTYTRGQGFTDGVPGDDVAAVILTSAGRVYVNPAHTQQEQIDDYAVRPGAFTGWTLPELAVLNTYRRRAA